MRHYLRDLAEIGAGQGAPQGDHNYSDDGLPFVKAGNLQELTFGGSINDIQKVSDEVAKAHKLKLYPKGTVLFAKSGMSCLKGYVYVLPINAYVVSHLACIIPKGDISEYLRLYFSFHKPNQLVKDAAYPSISLTDIGNLEVDTKDEQTRGHIITVLKSVEEIIELRTQELQKLDDLIKARFVEMFGRCIQRKRLEDYSVLITKGASPKWQGVDYSDEGTLFVTSENVREGYIDLSKRKYLPNTINEIQPRSVLHRNDVLINIVGASIGRAAIFDSDELANINQAVALVRLRENTIRMQFLITFLNSQEAQRSYGFMKKGGARDNLSLKNIADLLIPVATIAEQDKFADFVFQVDKSKVAVQKALDEAQLLFDSLMQQYFG